MSLITAKELREQRGRLIEQMKDINSRADKNGNLTELDEQQWKKLDEQQESLKNQADRITRTEQLKAETDATRVPEPNKNGEQRSKEDLQKEYREAYGRYIRLHKDQRLSEKDMAILEKRGTSDQVGSTDSLGGYLIPEGFSNELEKYMVMYGGMLEAATVMTTGSGNPFPYPTVDDTSNTGAYIDQGAADTVSDVTFGVINFPLVPTITSKVVKVAWELQQDSYFDLSNLIAELCGERIGRYANAQFTTGNTANKISGFITDASSGKTAAAPTTFTRGELLDLMHSVDPAYRSSPKARWMFNDTTLASIKKLSLGSGDDRPLWVPSMRDGAPDTLEGKPYTVNQSMDSPTTGLKPIAFGDFGKYKIRIAKGITLEMSRDRYWDERVTGFVALARMDGRLVNTSAIKYLTMA